VHDELGGRRLGICRKAVTVTGSVSDWELWTRRRFPGSGEFAVPGALTPVRIDRDADFGEYVEPNVWYFHAEAGEGG
jgi:hypothetical protein